MDPLPTPVSRAAFLANVTPDVAISVRTSKSGVSEIHFVVLTDVGELLTIGPARASLSLQVEEGQVRLLDLGPVLDVGSEELGRASPLLGSSGS